MLFRKRRAGNGPYELRLASMIDVVFLLLVFFLCATEFPEPEGVLRTWLPKGGRGDGDFGFAVRIALERRGEGVVCYHEDPASEEGFSAFPGKRVFDPQTGRDENWPDYERIEAFLQAQKTKYESKEPGESTLPVYLDFGRDVPWKHVARLIDICNGLGLTDIRIAVPEIPIQ